MSENRGSSFMTFLAGLMTGAVAGITAGVLLAPKAGEETRKDITKLGKKIQKDFTKYYLEAQEKVQLKLAMLKEIGQKIDENKYKSLVEEVIAELKDDASVTKEASQKLSSQLKSDWSMVKNQWTADNSSSKAKKSKKKATKK